VCKTQKEDSTFSQNFWQGEYLQFKRTVADGSDSGVRVRSGEGGTFLSFSNVELIIFDNLLSRKHKTHRMKKREHGRIDGLIQDKSIRTKADKVLPRLCERILGYNLSILDPVCAARVGDWAYIYLLSSRISFNQTRRWFLCYLSSKIRSKDSKCLTNHMNIISVSLSYVHRAS